MIVIFDMEFIGQHLKKHRISKKISLKTVASELKISQTILKDIEDDYFPEYISTVFIMGHIRSYSKFLLLDDKQIIDNFKIQTSYNINHINEEISKPIKELNF